MKKFYESVVKYDKTSESGEPVKVTEQYILTGMDCADVEQKLLADIAPFVQSESEIVSIKVSKYSEFIPENILISNVTSVMQNTMTIEMKEEDKATPKYYGAKISFITLDEAKGKEKKTSVHYLVQAVSVEAANKTVKLFMHDTLSDYEVNNIVETKIVDVLLEDSVEDRILRIDKMLESGQPI